VVVVWSSARTIVESARLAYERLVPDRSAPTSVACSMITPPHTYTIPISSPKSRDPHTDVVALRNVAKVRSALVRLASRHVGPLKVKKHDASCALDRFVPRICAKARFEPARLAAVMFAEVRFAWPRSAALHVTVK